MKTIRSLQRSQPGWGSLMGGREAKGKVEAWIRVDESPAVRSPMWMETNDGEGW